MFELTRPSLRAAGAIVVLLAWVASLGWLGYRQLGRSEAATLSAEATLRLAPGTVWYALYAGQTQVGTGSTTLDTLSPGYRIDQVVSYELRRGDALTRALRRTETWIGPTLNLERVTSRFSGEARQANWLLTIYRDTVTAHFTVSDAIAQGGARFSDAPTTGTVMGYRLALGGGLETGKSHLVVMLEGWPPVGREVEIRVGRDSSIRYADSSALDTRGTAWMPAHIDSSRSFAVMVRGPAGPRRIWVNQRGTVSAIETPLGLRWYRTDFDLSETNFRQSLPGRTAQILAATPELRQFAATPLLHDSAEVDRRFVVTFRDGSPVDTALLAMLGGGRQEVRGDTIIVHGHPERNAGEGSDDSMPDPMIQENAGAIDELARRLGVSGADRARLAPVMAALHRLIRVDTSIAARDDALGTLAARVGRPDGVARLFVAVLKSAGVPARYVIGVCPRGDTLLTHAWAEVWNPREGGWYAVDPVAGFPAASTRLIRVAHGGSSHPDEMFPLIAGARFTELAPEPQP